MGAEAVAAALANGSERVSMRLRWMQAGLGALAGLVLWGLIEVADRGNLTDRALLVLFAFFGTFFATCLVMAGPLTMRRAVLRAIVIGMLAGVLSLAVSQRFATVEETFNSVYRRWPCWLLSCFRCRLSLHRTARDGATIRPCSKEAGRWSFAQWWPNCSRPSSGVSSCCRMAC